METKVHCHRLELVCNRVGFHTCLMVNPVEKIGGLALLWKEDTSLKILKFANNHIHAKVWELGSEKLLYITGFYGTPITNRRQVSWSLLTSLNQSIDH